MTRIGPALDVIAAATTPDERARAARRRARGATALPRCRAPAAAGLKPSRPRGTYYIEHTKQEHRTSDEMTGFSAH